MLILSKITLLSCIKTILFRIYMINCHDIYLNKQKIDNINKKINKVKHL